MRTKKTPTRPAALLLLLPLLALLAATGAEAATFRLIYGNDNLGELDGCG
ncbi:MAG: hypothetical protein LBD10_01580 [Desulfobulbus sp.]|jgi:hypothetical protein|nr:hypothetical protein [Desulfobulbus sp.]MDR2548887.1 hypothetical protein [Desulfobulbus sp.]